MKIDILPILEDNYAYIIQSDDVTAIVDPGESAPIINYCTVHNLTPDFIINTHHHWDHTDGNEALIKEYNCQVIAPDAEQSKIGQVDITLKDGDDFTIGGATFTAIETAGHTQGHLCYFDAVNKTLLSGDMIFLMGCGRPMEGTAEDLFESVKKLNHLPDETKIYCGHEYTITNAKFALTVDPDNQDIQAALKNAEEKRKNKIPTVPTTMGIERKTNPFMRASNKEDFVNARNKRNNF